MELRWVKHSCTICITNLYVLAQVLVTVVAFCNHKEHESFCSILNNILWNTIYIARENLKIIKVIKLHLVDLNLKSI